MISPRCDCGTLALLGHETSDGVKCLACLITRVLVTCHQTTSNRLAAKRILAEEQSQGAPTT